MDADNAHGVSLRETYATSRALNVGDGERVLSLAAGVGLVALGARRGGVLGALGVLGGAGLALRGVTGHSFVYDAIGRNTASRKAQGMARMEPGASASVPLDRGIMADERVVIRRPVGEVYAFFRDLHHLPEVMRHVERVEVSSAELSHWTVKGPAGTRLEWDAEIINDRPDELIAWRSREGADVRSAGSVQFAAADGGDATEVRVKMKYDPPAGALGAAVAGLLGEAPEAQLREDLQRLKAALERAQSAV
jgi:uncharacterized membrane protein